MLRENIFIVLRAPEPRVAHSLAFVVAIKSLLVVSSAHRQTTEREGGGEMELLLVQWCAKSVSLRLDPLSFHYSTAWRGLRPVVCLICTFISPLSLFLSSLSLALYRTAESDY